MSTKSRSLADILKEFRQHRVLMQEELQKVIVGQDDVIEQLFAAIFTRGHCLLEGVPGLAKTLMVSTLARILDVDFARIQFTPDLMPSDITGTNVLEEDDRGRRQFRFVEGPIFTIRTQDKAQSAGFQRHGLGFPQECCAVVSHWQHQQRFGARRITVPRRSRPTWYFSAAELLC